MSSWSMPKRVHESRQRPRKLSTGHLIPAYGEQPVAGGVRRIPAAPTLEGVSAIRYVEAGFGAGAVDYETAWAEQRRLHAEVAEGTGSDTVILLEHPPVYTAGKRTEPHERPVDGTPVV